MSKPADTTFNGGPSDRLAAVDVYEEKETLRKNNHKSEDGGFTAALDNALGKTKEYGSDVKRRTKEKDLDPKESAETVKRALSGSKPAMDKVGTDVSDIILGDISKGSNLNVPGGDGNYYKTFKVIKKNNEDAATELNDVDVESAQGVFDLVSDVIGTPMTKGEDMGVHASVLHGAMEKMTEWGVPELIDETLEKIADKKLRREVARRSALKLARSGNIDMVESAIKHAGADALVAMHPRIPQIVLQTYKFKSGTTPADYPRLLNQLVWVMDRLQPNWLWTQRAGKDVWNLATMYRISDDARALFCSNPDYRTPALISEHYPRKAVNAVIRQMYPRASIA